MWWCYALRSTVSGRTYVGSTNDPARRLRQHNGWRSGGARATATSRPWRFLYLLTAVECAAFDHVAALSMEWHLKRRRPRPAAAAAAAAGAPAAKHAHRWGAMARALARPAAAALGASWVVWVAPEHVDDAWAALSAGATWPCVLPLEAGADAPEDALAVDALAAHAPPITAEAAPPKSWPARARTRRSGRPRRTASPPASARGGRARRRTRRQRASRAT